MLEGMCMDLEAANSKENSRQLFQIAKSMTRKFQPHLQYIQSATGENLTEAAQMHKLQTGGKSIVKACTVMRKGKESKKNIGSKSLHRFVHSCSCHPSDSKSQSHRS